MQLGYFERRLLDVANLSCGGMLTEFDVDGVENEMITSDLCDEFQISWIGLITRLLLLCLTHQYSAWEYKSFAGALPNGTWYVCLSGIV